MEIRVIFDNYPAGKGWGAGWGFSALVDRDLLFDTGSDPDIFLQNLLRIVEPEEIKQVVISHPHWDHTGGLLSLANKNPDLEVYVGEGFSKKFQEELERKGVKVFRGNGWRKIRENIWIGPELKEPVPEQFLAVENGEAVLILAGCSHPGIENFARLASEKFGKPLWVLGGFHLFSSSLETIRKVAEQLKNAGVVKAYPSHCTGDKAFKIFADYFEVERAGSGKSIKF